MKTRIGKISLTVLLTIVSVLLAVNLVVRPSNAVPVGRQNIATAVAAVQTTVDIIELLNADELARFGVGPGNVFYVNSAATGTGDAASWVNADTTINAALDHCTASAGDFIFVAPGHNVALTGADDVDVDVIGVTIIGIGNGSLKPTFDYDNANGEFVIGADNVTIKNLRFRVSANAVTKAIDIEANADHATIIDCDFGFAETSTDEFTECIIFNNLSNYGRVEGCYFDAGSQAAASAIMFNEDTHGTVIKDNVFLGTWATAIIEGATAASTSLLIINNDMFGIGSADTFNLYAGSTGIVARNTIVMNATSAATALDIGDCMNMSNTLIADDDVGGTKGEPAFTSAYSSVTASADG